MALQGLFADVFVVDDAVGIHAVGNDVIVHAGHVDGAAVGQVAAVGKIHAHEGVAGLQYGKEHSHVGLCAGMRLYVGIITVKQLFGTLDRQGLHNVHALAAAVIALSGIPFSILVGQYAAHCQQDFLGNDVLGCDQLQIAALSGQLGLHRLTQFLVIRCQSLQCLIYHFDPPDHVDCAVIFVRSEGFGTTLRTTYTVTVFTGFFNENFHCLPYHYQRASILNFHSPAHCFFSEKYGINES